MGALLTSSVLIVLGVVPVSVLISTMAGFAIGHLRIPGSRALFVLFLLGLTLPLADVKAVNLLDRRTRPALGRLLEEKLGDLWRHVLADCRAASCRGPADTAADKPLEPCRRFR